MTLYPDAPYEYSAEAHGLVFTAGACPLDEEGEVVAPGETLLGVSCLGCPDQLVEIEAIAAREPPHRSQEAQAARSA